MSEAGDVREKEREGWTKKEIDYLMRAWGEDPILLISIKLGRSITSVTTKASRCGLTQRDVNPDRHRSRWTNAEDTILDQIFYQRGGLDDLTAFANARSRTLDAVVSRIVSRHGQNGLKDLLKASVDQSVIDALKMKADDAPVVRHKDMRRCMNPECRLEFITPDRRRVHYCPKCRRNAGYDD